MLVIFGSLAAFFFVLERLRPARAQGFFRDGFVADLLYIPVHYGLRVAFSFVAADLVARSVRGFLPGGRGLLSKEPLWIQVLVVVVSLDLLFYAMHRMKHRFGWWWRLHETHHSSETLDFLSATRFHPLEKVLDRAVFLAPLALLDPSETALVVWSSIDVFLGMLNHSNVQLRFGPLRYIFVVPEMHRWHHARGDEKHGCNFGNNLSLFDWLLGTAVLPPAPPDRFGLDEPGYPHDDILGQFAFAFRPAGRPGLAARLEESRATPEAAARV